MAYVFTPFNITNLPDGAYALDLIDANGYTWTDTVYLTSPLPLTATLIPTLLPTASTSLVQATAPLHFLLIISPAGHCH